MTRRPETAGPGTRRPETAGPGTRRPETAGPITQRHRTLAPCYPRRCLPFTQTGAWPAIVGVAIATSVTATTVEVLMHRSFRSLFAVAAAGGLCLAGGAVAAAAPAFGASAPQNAGVTATPIKHLVVIFQENVSFDHYFGTYPSAANTDGNPFHALTGTPSVNGLTPALLNHNPNSANPQ